MISLTSFKKTICLSSFGHCKWSGDLIDRLKRIQTGALFVLELIDKQYGLC